MKTSIFLFLFSFTLASFNTLPNGTERPTAEATNKLAVDILNALKNRSSDQYLALFASLGDLQQLMKAHSKLYGADLEEALEDFAHAYVNEVLPSGRATFDKMIAEGIVTGIDWKNTKLVRADVNDVATPDGTVSLSIVIADGSQTQVLKLEKVFYLNNALGVTQFISLQ